MTVDLCLCCDHHAVDGLVAVLAASSRHLRKGATLHAHVLDCGLGEELAGRVAETVRCHLPNVRLDRVELERGRLDVFPHPTGLKHASKATYAKLLLHELYPHLNEVIYLDCDLLVQHDLGVMALLPMNGHRVGAVLDASVRTLGGSVETLFAQLPTLPPEAPYFNAGVLKLDLAQLRASDATGQFLQMTNSLSAHFGDQSIWNAVFANQWQPLPACWNVQIFLLPIFNVFPERRHAIWHFVRDQKPWHFFASNSYGLVARWRSELARVGWKQAVNPRHLVQESVWRASSKLLVSKLTCMLARG